MFEDEPKINSFDPDRQKVIESIFLERREHARRGYMPRELQDQPRAEVAHGVVHLPAQTETQSATKLKTRPPLERRLSLEEMSRTLTGKRRRA